ncbi:hypothetical protein M885DRAFT_262522 [Pelagophyceae sp. CCMP2097]|nr:hypothetical protein M885DRAFT_262522 [Pelagophyceae sp. CCMP2097]
MMRRVNIDDDATRLYASIAAKVLENPQSCTPQHLANLAWAFAVSGAEAPFLFEALAEQTLLKKEAFQPQHLARTLRAISSVQRLDASFEPHPPGKHALALFESIDHVKWFDARSLASVAWAFSRAGISNLKLFNAIAEQVPRHLDAFQARDVSDLAWAFGKLADASEIGGIEPLFEKLAQASVDKLYLFKPHSLARLVGAFADLGLSSPALFQAVKRPASVGYRQGYASWIRRETRAGLDSRTGNTGLQDGSRHKWDSLVWAYGDHPCPV